MSNNIETNIKEKTPNETTLEALAELEEIKKHPEDHKVYNSVEELINNLK